ncbi:MAG: hypothetical protein R3264_05325 [Anaerolineae bacterium]|nr:hypothetical protein [Anaerolineae bacterium]
MTLQKLWEGWKGYGHFIGNLLARVVLSLFYFTVLVPFGVGVRLFSDPLKIKRRLSPQWLGRETGDQTIENLKRQY